MTILRSLLPISIIFLFIFLSLFILTLLSSEQSPEGAINADKNVTPRPLVFAHYYGWYDINNWALATNDAFLGLYKSLDNNIIRQHIIWAKRAGLTALSVSWAGQSSLADKTIKDYLAPALDKETISGSDFFILVEMADMVGTTQGQVINFSEEYSPGVTRGQKFLDEMNYLADMYFDRRSYYKINNRPVVFFYIVRDLINHQYYFDQLKANMQIRGYNLYLIADVVYWQDPVTGIVVPGAQPLNWTFLKNHFQGITGYNMYNPSRNLNKFLDDVKVQWRKFKNQAVAFELRFFPFVLPSYDDRNLRGDSRPILTRNDGEFYSRYWAMVYEFVDIDVPIVFVTSFNEWYEGTEIEPSTQYSTQYIDLTKSMAEKFVEIRRSIK